MPEILLLIREPIDVVLLLVVVASPTQPAPQLRDPESIVEAADWVCTFNIELQIVVYMESGMVKLPIAV